VTGEFQTGAVIVVALTVIGVGLFVVASLAGRWPLWIAGFLVTGLALVATYLVSPGTHAVPSRGGLPAAGGAPDSIAADLLIHYNPPAAPIPEAEPNPQPQGTR
jgi:hypothetical protein